jgi:hypothetical protein
MMESDNGVKAFSEKSVINSMNSGLIDNEGRLRLRSIKADAVKVKAYDRAVEKLMLKNCKQSTSVKVSVGQMVKPTEIMFGTQKVRTLDVGMTDVTSLCVALLCLALKLSHLIHKNMLYMFVCVYFCAGHVCQCKHCHQQ